ncbi:hypothetical protein [Radicibacter daui]|uniref:hypothetical protein n=1 Tax=Radicibacter daui TaxID=3064829 RepID=UPI004046D417
MANFSWIKSDERTIEANLWKHWLQQVPKIRSQFIQAMQGDPFVYNETASVGLLASAASRSGLLAMSEYVSIKRGTGRGRPYRNGRCDLWVGAPETGRSWAFEMKQLIRKKALNEGTIEVSLEAACSDARKVHLQEATFRYGCLIIASSNENGLSGKSVERIHVAAQATDFACQLDIKTNPVWLLFKKV